MLRFRLDADRVHIGRDQGNDIWLEHPNVPSHALVVYKRDGRDNLKVYDGAKVMLNGSVVTGMHRLYSGDRIGVVDREFIYADDDTPPDVALGLTIMDGDAVERAVVLRRTRIVLGRRDCHVDLDDPSVADRHLVLECYSPEAIYAADLGAGAGAPPGGEPVEQRRRVRDKTLLKLGRVTVRLQVLPVEAFGLLVTESDKPRSADDIAPKPRLGAGGARPGAQPAAEAPPARARRDSTPAVEPPRAGPAERAPTPAPTMIGALSDLGEQFFTQTPRKPRPNKHPPAAAPPAPRPAPAPRSRPAPAPLERARPRRDTGERPSARPDTGPRHSRNDSWKPQPADGPAGREAPAPRRRRELPAQPSVRVRPDMLERGGPGSASAPPRIAPREQERRYGGGREDRPPEREHPGSRAAPRKRTGFHEQLTDVLQSESVQQQVREHFRRTGDHAPAWMELEEERYRPSRAGAPPPARREPPAERGQAAAPEREPPYLRRRAQDAPVEPAYMQRRRKDVEYRPVDKVHLTNVMDVVPERERLDRSRHPIEADSYAEQSRRDRAQAAHDADTRPRGPVDDARRRRRQLAVDDSPRYYRDDEE